MRILAATIAGLLLLSLTALPMPQAVAKCRDVKKTKIVKKQLIIYWERECGLPDVIGDEGDRGADPVVVVPGGKACSGAAAVAGGVDTDEFCAGEPEEADPALTITTIARAFRRIELPASTLQVQPPGGKTLVNFDTNFYTVADPIHRSVRLLGQRVEFRIWADAFTWRFGDGETSTTSEPGAPYPALDVTHNYLQTGDYAPSVDTTYVAQWRVGGGAWSPVPGSATIPGASVAVRAIEATPTLVGYGD